MKTNPNEIRRALVVLKLPRTSVLALVAYAEAIVKAMRESRYFPKAPQMIASLQKGIGALRAAEVRARSGTRGAAAVRDAKRVELVSLIDEVGAHVQTAADRDPPNGHAIVVSAGLSVRKPPVRSLRFRAKLGREPGTVIVMAPAAARRAAYDWEYSFGETWTPMPSTLQARTSLSDLPAMKVVQIRYRAVTKDGPGEWSEPVAILVPEGW